MTPSSSSDSFSGARPVTAGAITGPAASALGDRSDVRRLRALGTLALLFLCAGAAAAALPIGPAGTATQVGASGAALIASGVGASQPPEVALSVGILGVLSGAAILLFAIVWRTGLRLMPAQALLRS